MQGTPTTIGRKCGHASACGEPCEQRDAERLAYHESQNNAKRHRKRQRGEKVGAEMDTRISESEQRHDTECNHAVKLLLNAEQRCLRLLPRDLELVNRMLLICVGEHRR